MSGWKRAVTNARQSVPAFCYLRRPPKGQAMKRVKRIYTICIGTIAAVIVLMTGAVT
jgi:hypothetical protein